MLTKHAVSSIQERNSDTKSDAALTHETLLYDRNHRHEGLHCGHAPHALSWLFCRHRPTARWSAGLNGTRPAAGTSGCRGARGRTHMRHFMRKPAVVLFAVALMASGVIGSMVFPADARIDEIRIADGKGAWGYPNPFRHYPRGPGYLRMSWAFDTLVWKDAEGFIPALAESWHYDPASLTFTFDLRENITWHDGRRLDADDVAFTVTYFKEHPYQWVPLEVVLEAKAVDATRVIFTLARPYAPFMEYIAGTMPIIPKHVWEEVKDPRRYDDPRAFIGSGPYRFVDFDKAKGTYLYEAFDDYYQGRPKAARLIYVKAADPIMALSTGKADVANIKPDMARILEKKGMTIVENARGWNKKLMINHRIPPFDDRRFRHALAHAIDRREIIEKAHRGYGSPASFGLLSPDNEFYSPHTRTYLPDPVAARRILESLGYERGPDGFYTLHGEPLTVEILVSNISVAGARSQDRDGEVIKRQLERVGIRVDLLTMEQTTTDGRVKNWEFQLAVSGHGGLLGDPTILKQMISPDSSGSVNSAPVRCRQGASGSARGPGKGDGQGKTNEAGSQDPGDLRRGTARHFPLLPGFHDRL